MFVFFIIIICIFYLALYYIYMFFYCVLTSILNFPVHIGHYFKTNFYYVVDGVLEALLWSQY